MKCVVVKYCGGCNPQIERSRFVEELRQKLSGDLRLEIGGSTGRKKCELGILVCGCGVACADRPETRSMASKWILVSGPAVDMAPTPENEMAGCVALKIRKYFERRLSHEME
jgi:hypothetical protein